MKSSPGGVGGGGPGTPRDDSGSGMGDYNLSEYIIPGLGGLPGAAGPGRHGPWGGGR